jgi:alpha-mannosidase
MLKLSLPTPDKSATYLGQVAFGADTLPDNGDEAVAQKWVAVVSKERHSTLTVVNDGIYGSDFYAGELRLSLLRSPAYSGHPIMDRPILPDDRYTPRIDQGERLYRFWIKGGALADRLETIEREALAHNEKPMALSFFPVGGAKEPMPFVTLSDGVIQLVALKKAEGSDDFILRLFEPTGQVRSTILKMPSAGLEKEIELKGFEVRTFRVNLKSGLWQETNLVEEVV